jgi:hypothetical protein
LNELEKRRKDEDKVKDEVKDKVEERRFTKYFLQTSVFRLLSSVSGLQTS